MTKGTRFICLFVLLTAAYGGFPAYAEGDLREARAHAERAIRQYNLGNFEEAIKGFRKAYEIDPSPILLFNIGQVHRYMGNSEQAIFFFRRYLNETKSNAPSRDEAERHIHDLELKILEDKVAREGQRDARPIATAVATSKPSTTPNSAAGTTAPATKLALDPPTPLQPAGPTLVSQSSPAVMVDHSENRPLAKKRWFWAIVGIGVAAGIVGAVELIGRGDQVIACPSDAHCVGARN